MSGGARGKKPGPREKLFWLGAGTVLTLLLFELGFRALGPFFERDGSRTSSAEHVILCEGDSFTYGIGGLAFPQQLESLLNERAGKRLFRAVNKGVPGLNTALLADRLEGHYRKYRPSVAIVTVGENNSWNSIRLSDPAGRSGAAGALERLLLRSRVYKFLKVMTVGWRHGTFHEAAGSGLDEVEKAAHYLTETEESIGLPGPEAEDEAEEDEEDDADVPEKSRGLYAAAQAAERSGRYEEAIGRYSDFVKRHPDIVLGYTGLGAMYMRFNRFPEAIAALERGLRAPRTRETQSAYFELGWAYRRAGRAEEAREAWTRGLEAFPRSKQIYQSLAKLNFEEGDIWRTLEAARKAPGVEENPLHLYLERLKERHGKTDMARLVSESFRRDIVRIVELGERYGVRTILSSYPDHAYPEVAAVAAEKGVAYVDFRPLFKKRFRSREEYISADDCHCNTAGYRLMAETFADEVERLLRERQY